MPKIFPLVVVVIAFCLLLMIFAMTKAIDQQTAYDNDCRQLGGTPAHAEGFRGCFAPGVLLTVPSK